MFKSRQKRNDPYGIKPQKRAEPLDMLHGDPVTIALARRVSDSLALQARAARRSPHPAL